MQPARVAEVPQQNDTAVETPFAFTEPFNVADVPTTDVAGEVVTDAEVVVNDRIDPFAAPPTFVPETRK